MTTRSRLLLLVGAAAALAVMPDAAHAAIGGGGGSGVVDSIIQWFMQNVARGLVMLGIIGIAVMMFVKHFSPATIACVVGGALILANADTIAGYFGF